MSLIFFLTILTHFPSVPRFVQHDPDFLKCHVCIYIILFKLYKLQDAAPLEPVDEVTNDLKSWNSRRANILNKYTTGEKLTIVSSFLPGGEKSKWLTAFLGLFN